MANMKKCFACGKRLGQTPRGVDTGEDQWVFVGSECFKLIKAAGKAGYQPAQGGPKLYALTPERWQYFVAKGMT